MLTKHIGLFLLVPLAVSLTYSNHFYNSFHFDDSHTITDNPYLRDLRNIPRFFTDATTFSVLPTNQAYRPVVSASLALDYWMGNGYKVVWFHVSSFFWFLVQLGGMYLLFTAIMDRVRMDSSHHVVAALATAWYGLHPANAETVNYIIQRGEIYSTLGVVAALALYARFPGWRKKQLYLLPLVFAVLSKPGALVFPFLLFLYVFYFEENADSTRLGAALRRCVPALVLCAILLWLSSAMTPRSFLAGIIPAYRYRITQPYVWLRYFGSFFLPIHLSADTDLNAFPGWNAEAMAGVLFVLTIALTIWITARPPLLRPISFGLAWFVIASLPTSIYPLSEVENDHRMYFPSIGLTLAVCWSIELLLEHFANQGVARLRRVTALASVCALCAYAGGTWRRNQAWHSEESLWHDVTLKSPHNGRGLMNYGLTQMSEGKYVVALDYFERASVFNPAYPLLEINLGVANGALGRAQKAEAHFQRALSLAPFDAQPDYYYGRWLDQVGRTSEAVRFLQTAMRLNPSWIEARTLLMRVYSDSGDMGNAIKVAQETLRSFPGDVSARQFLANPPIQNADYWVTVSLREYRAGRYQKSIAAAREALKHKPDSFEAYNNIAAAYSAMGMWDLAIQNVSESLRINPNFEVAQNNLAWYKREIRNVKAPSTPEDFLSASLRYHQAGQYNESIEAARAALRLRPGYAEAYNNLAAAYESMEKWDEAIAAASEAVRLKPDFELARNNLAWARQQKRRTGDSRSLR